MRLHSVCQLLFLCQFWQLFKDLTITLVYQKKDKHVYRLQKKQAWSRYKYCACIVTRKRAPKSNKTNSKVKRPLLEQRNIFGARKKDYLRGGAC